MKESAYRFIVVVLGTNDIPTVSTRKSAWAALRTAISNGIANLKRYLHLTARSTDLIITQSFNFAEGRAVEDFSKLLAEECRSA